MDILSTHADTAHIFCAICHGTSYHHAKITAKASSSPISYSTATARHTHLFSGYISPVGEISGRLHQEYLEPVDNMIQVLSLKYSVQYLQLNFCIMTMGTVFAGRH